MGSRLIVDAQKYEVLHMLLKRWQHVTFFDHNIQN